MVLNSVAFKRHFPAAILTCRRIRLYCQCPHWSIHHSPKYGSRKVHFLDLLRSNTFRQSPIIADNRQRQYCNHCGCGYVLVDTCLHCSHLLYKHSVLTSSQGPSGNQTNSVYTFRLTQFAPQAYANTHILWGSKFEAKCEQLMPNTYPWTKTH